MNSAQAKKIPLSRILERLGYEPHHEVRGELWYSSPFRKESEPSFKIKIAGNIWYDFGEGKGGNVLDFIMEMFNLDNIPFALRKLEDLMGQYKYRDTQPVDMFTSPSRSLGSRRSDETTLEIVKVQELQNEALISYLRERSISKKTAQPYVKEIYYKRSGKNYFALCFANDSGGYELRNKYFKGVHGTKDISVIERKEPQESFSFHQQGSSTVTVFEGFMDFLSALEYYRKPIATAVIVLNSVQMRDKAIAAIKGMEASKVYLYLDRDDSGMELAGYFQQQLQSMTIVDNSDLYASHKDFNEFLVKVGH